MCYCVFHAYESGRVFTFDDLIFKPHRIGLGHVQAKHTFKNGNSVSVVGGEMLNGNGVDTWESVLCLSVLLE